MGDGAAGSACNPARGKQKSCRYISFPPCRTPYFLTGFPAVEKCQLAGFALRSYTAPCPLNPPKTSAKYQDSGGKMPFPPF